MRASMPTAAPPTELTAVDPGEALVVVPCSKSKSRGGVAPTTVGYQADWPDELRAARERLRAAADVEAGELRPAVERYTGNFYAPRPGPARRTPPAMVGC